MTEESVCQREFDRHLAEVGPLLKVMSGELCLHHMRTAWNRAWYTRKSSERSEDDKA